jgi:hypothetical protein
VTIAMTSASVGVAIGMVGKENMLILEIAVSEKL